ncbi:TetR/AcrR family transcriptional regulator [Deinococcus petrolearius]|uniref:TetR/AcrR family transcriptional regulator n=1 Tax=Deinococcus petrolearius TaxID=1751295 RepID=A0ABW1DJ80_9DEIO
MPDDTPRPLRARNADEKKRRRTEILDAAERLWSTASYSELSMSQVAAEAQLAKGTLYLYFDTKEELFLALLTSHLQRWGAACATRLREERPRTPDALTEVLLRGHSSAQPLRRLLLLYGAVLERNASPTWIQQAQQVMAQVLRDIVQELPYPPETSARLVMHLYALSVGWHQVAELGTRFQTPQGPPGLGDLLFEDEFTYALQALLRQLLPQLV